MTRHPHAWLFSVIVLACLAAPAPAQTVVYDNLDFDDFGDFYPYLLAGVELGDEITLAAGPRRITQFRIAPGSSEAISRFDLTLRLYEATPSGPGNELWSGDFPAIESYGGIFVTYDLPVPSVQVPDTFCWSVEVTYHPGFTVGAAYLNAFGGPVLGSSGPFVWVFDHPSFGPGWVAASSGPCTDCVFNLACRIWAEGGASPDPTFQRGDTNDDGGFDISDPIYLLAWLFVAGSPDLACEDASDVNDDGAIDISDAVYQLAALFVPGSPGPSADCIVDPTTDSLDCTTTLTCP